MPRTAIFNPKDPNSRLQGALTKRGSKAFEAARVRLGQLYESIFGRPPTTLSDADTIEYLARGRNDCVEQFTNDLDKLRREGR